MSGYRRTPELESVCINQDKSTARFAGRVVRVSYSSSRKAAIVWCFVVATGPLQRGQLTTMVSASGQTGCSMVFSSNFGPMNFHRRKRKHPLGGGKGTLTNERCGSRFWIRTYSPEWRSSSESGTRLTSSAVVGIVLTTRNINEIANRPFHTRVERIN
jgi:hypothetical protein